MVKPDALLLTQRQPKSEGVPQDEEGKLLAMNDSRHPWAQVGIIWARLGVNDSIEAGPASVHGMRRKCRTEPRKKAIDML